MEKNQERSKLVINQFVLKLIAIITMTIDHIGVMCEMYIVNFYDSIWNTVLRGIGRLAFPLFIFMLVDGINHTRSKLKYMIRIGVIAAAILIAQIILSFFNMSLPASPFFDLLFIGLTLCFLKQKGWKKVFAILPAGYIITTTIFTICNVSWFPDYLCTSYGIYGLILGCGIFLSYPIAMRRFKKNLPENIDEKDIMETEYYQIIKNLYSILAIVLTNVVGWVIMGYIFPSIDYINIKIQCYSIIASVPIFFYNGKRGYNAPWFKYGTYFYFALHLIILFVIFQLVFVGSLF